MTKHWDPGGFSGPPRGPRRIGWPEWRLMILAGLFLGLAATRVSWEWPLPSEGSAPVAAAAIRVIDGDTFEHDGMPVRIADIDAPEVNGRCAYESDLAARATGRLRALLAGGDVALHPSPDGRDEDRYGRKLRIVTRGGRSVGDMLVAEGLAREWRGRREPWC